MHTRLNYLYSCNCPDCEGKEFATLASDDTILKIAEKAFQKLYKLGKYEVEKLLETKEFKSLLTAIKNKFNRGLMEGLSDNKVPAEMSKALKEDIYIFSALKTHAQLQEASQQLLNEDGSIRSFQQFEQAYQQINNNYNKNYLEAEYEFTVASAQSVSKWVKIDNNKGRYYIQYRTAGDERVRVSHRALNGITLPADDPFWNYFATPNGWRCRCNEIEVLKDKYKASDSQKAYEAGIAATTEIGANNKNRLEIFRFNPARQKVIFPPHHPYRKVQDANKVLDQVIQ